AELGGAVLLLKALDQPIDAFLLHHGVEFAAIGQHQADSFHGDVVDLPALAFLAHLELDRQRLCARADGLRAPPRPVLFLRPWRRAKASPSSSGPGRPRSSSSRSGPACCGTRPPASSAARAWPATRRDRRRGASIPRNRCKAAPFLRRA